MTPATLATTLSASSGGARLACVVEDDVENDLDPHSAVVLTSTPL